MIRIKLDSSEIVTATRVYKSSITEGTKEYDVLGNTINGLVLVFEICNYDGKSSLLFIKINDFDKTEEMFMCALTKGWLDISFWETEDSIFVSHDTCIKYDLFEKHIEI